MNDTPSTVIPDAAQCGAVRRGSHDQALRSNQAVIGHPVVGSGFPPAASPGMTGQGVHDIWDRHEAEEAALRTTPAPLLPRYLLPVRDLAARAGWPSVCSERVCRETGACRGRLHRIADGPRCYPTCCHLVARGLHDPRGLTVSETERYFEHVYPGQGIGLVPARLDDPLLDALDAFGEAECAMEEAAATARAEGRLESPLPLLAGLLGEVAPAPA